MPKAQLKAVYAVSSEDPVHPAENLLRIQSGKKWKCKNNGVNSVYVVLQLDQPHHITGIDIGNEHAAFATVAVGNLPYKDTEFKEILITSSFMTPIESKNSSNVNRVRCFANNALVESVAKEKWELIKIICSQPFNRHVQYGLSFLTVHVSDSKAAEGETGQANLPASKKCPGSKTDNASMRSLFLREDSPDSDSESSPSLFNRWKQSRNSPVSTAAAIRDASSPAALKNSSNTLKPSKINLALSNSSDGIAKHASDEKSVRNRNHDRLLYDVEDEIPNERLEQKISEDQTRINKEKEALKKVQKLNRNQSVVKSEDENRTDPPHKEKHSRKDTNYKDGVVEKRNGRDSPGTSVPGATKEIACVKRSLSPINTLSTTSKQLKHDTAVKYTAFKELLKGVVLVISGIQNPDRGILRQKAVDLGARYKPDWDDSCTHLICAFKNTPKYRQVQRKGKIITRQWIEKCHALKKRLPWRRFALDDQEAEKPESEDEVWDVSLKPKDEKEDSSSTSLKSNGVNESKERDASLESIIKPATSKRKESSHDNVLAQYDSEENRDYIVTSGSDTDEDIERIKMQKQTPVNAHKNDSEDLNVVREAERTPHRIKASQKKYIAYEESTDEDTIIQIPNDAAKAAAIFHGINFYLNKNLKSIDVVKIRQYITQFQGQFVVEPKDADYLISYDKVQDAGPFRGEVVSPLWIFECYDMECKIPTRRYIV